ncbi:MAG: hypothetical protein NZ920_05170 [Aigarchaeota archaeon]|nr:hypothetical protein [Aigarchaeota archaeon]MDW8093324.1 hypothetical protein [Nitrososphaerota archaeon]
MHNTVLLDSTIREGELYVILPIERKVAVAELLANVGVRRVEVTVDYPPRTTRADVEPVVRALKDAGVEVVMHGRAYRQDIDSIMKYNVDGVAVYMAVSQLHLDHKLKGIQLEEAISRITESVSYAAGHGFKYVRATLEDFSRLFIEGKNEELERLFSFTDQLRSAGATLVSLPDTSGLMTPKMAAEFTRYAKSKSKLPIACHFHNDYGHASANTVMSVLEGADEVHVSILGIGDRNGIADLYEVVAALHDIHGIDLGVERGALNHVYHEFSKLTGVKIPWRHPLSEQSKTVRAGVHQSMVIKRPEGYVPSMKLKYDYEGVRFSASPYVSHKLVMEVLRTAGVEVDDQTGRQIAESIATLYHQKSGRLSVRDITELMRRSIGVDIREDLVAKFFGEERVYVLVKIDPQYPVNELIRELLSWDDVDSVDEVYGDADLVIEGRLRFGSENLVERIRKRLGANAKKVNVLIAD